jgi:hypothetical protein
MVSTAINFICESLGSKFSTTRGELSVFHNATFVVNTGLEATCKQTVHFYYVQSTTKDKPKVLNDIHYWQQQYNKSSSMRQSNRKRKARDTCGN